jgi:hypothetical protein
MIDTMLCCQNHIDNPLIKASSNNSLVIKSLLQVPIERFLRRDRERVMKSWLPNPENEQTKETALGSAPLENNVLGLKVKIMKRPTFYEVGDSVTRCISNAYQIQGMKFADLVHLVDALESSSSPGAQVKLGLFKDLARSTLL